MDIERTIQFILETQAKREIAIQQSDERFARFREQTEERFRGLVDVSMSLARHGEETDRRLTETDRLIKELRDAQAEAHARTEYRLKALIDTVEKLVKRNGSRE